jgi:hypothetical protein
VSDSKPLPTDVTSGLYSPKALNPSGSGVNGNPSDYGYLQQYTPSPPVVAAPDMRSCNGGQCKVVGLNTISVDSLADGIVNGGAGSHVATLRFYAWASHEQMPLRRIVVDWGDGTQTDLPDAFMKNHKPFCQTTKECLYAPGLTCESDTDCPAGAGTCEAFGTCASHPNMKCHKDSECTFGGKPGTCNPRVYFGNDANACDEQYFEFRHAYTCLPNNHPSDTQCPMNGVCSSDPNHDCTTSANCATGDRCIQNSSHVPNGCYDPGTNTCRFTPRVMVIDNWGWCTGECRNVKGVNGPTDSGSSVLHPNGGCFDASLIKKNTYPSESIGKPGGLNECSLTSPSSGNNADPDRPWIVFPGSVQLLTGKAQ